jgi:hypothetical protein
MDGAILVGGWLIDEMMTMNGRTRWLVSKSGLSLDTHIFISSS